MLRQGTHRGPHFQDGPRSNEQLELAALAAEAVWLSNEGYGRSSTAIALGRSHASQLSEFMFRYFNVLFAIAAAIGLAWVITRPTKAECVASGRIVDPTERHCNAGASYVQLQEHAWFHSREVVLGAGILWVGAYLLRRRQARRQSDRALNGPGDR